METTLSRRRLLRRVIPGAGAAAIGYAALGHSRPVDAATAAPAVASLVDVLRARAASAASRLGDATLADTISDVRNCYWQIFDALRLRDSDEVAATIAECASLFPNPEGFGRVMNKCVSVRWSETSPGVKVLASSGPSLDALAPQMVQIQQRCDKNLASAYAALSSGAALEAAVIAQDAAGFAACASVPHLLTLLRLSETGEGRLRAHLRCIAEASSWTASASGLVPTTGEDEKYLDILVSGDIPLSTV